MKLLTKRSIKKLVLFLIPYYIIGFSISFTFLIIFSWSIGLIVINEVMSICMVISSFSGFPMGIIMLMLVILTIEED